MFGGMNSFFGRAGPDQRRSGAALIIAIVALLVALSALPRAALAQSYVFSSVVVTGNERVADSTVIAYASVPLGKSVTAGELDAAYQRVLASGLFETVTFSPKGSRLLIAVTENPVVNRISVEGNSAISDEAAKEFIKTTPSRIYNAAQVEQDALALTNAYRDRGRYSATVTPKIIRRSNNRVDVVFEVHEGRVVEVERISFVGNKAYPDSRLRRVLLTKQAGILRALVRSDTFAADRIALDKQVLHDFYLARGFVDFRILSVSSEFSRERNAFFITYNIQEGQRFRFGKATVSSDLPEVDAGKFEKLISVRPGSIYNPQDVDRTISRMETAATKMGLSFVRVEPRVTRNDRDLTLDIDFALTRGPRIFVERIDINGNVTTLDRVIRRQFHIAEGDPFNPREIREAAARIRALGLFSATDVQARKGSADDQVLVDVSVEETTTGSLSFGATYSLSTGVGLTAKFSERNFLGRGQTLNFDFILGIDNSQGGLTFIEPALLGRDLQFRFDGQYRETQYTYTNYDTRTIQFSPSIDFPVGERTRLGLRYSATNNKIFHVSANSSPVLKAEAAAGALLTSAVGYSVSYDTRGFGSNPDTGVLLRVGQDFAGLGGNAKYIKTTATLGAETSVLNRDIKLRATLEGGALTMFGSDSRLTDRFFLTSSRMRGFQPAGVGPRDLTVANKDALGGNYFAVARLESEFPLGLPPEVGLTGGFFFDIGSVWGLDNTNGGAIDDSMHLRSTAGASIFWRTGIGPLRFNFSKVLKKLPYDKEQTFDLTLSTSF